MAVSFCVYRQLKALQNMMFDMQVPASGVSLFSHTESKNICVMSGLTELRLRQGET